METTMKDDAHLKKGTAKAEAEVILPLQWESFPIAFSSLMSIIPLRTAFGNPISEYPGIRFQGF